MQYEVINSVPPPKAWRKYPFASMAVGDSFFVECRLTERREVARRVRVAAWNWAYRNDKTKKFSVRHQRTGVRAWRIA